MRENKEKFAKPYTKQKKYATIYGEFILSDPPHRGIETIYFANRQITSKPAAFRPMVLSKIIKTTEKGIVPHGIPQKITAQQPQYTSPFVSF